MASMSGPAIVRYEAVKAGSPPMSANAAGSAVPSRLNVHWIDVPVIGSVMVYGSMPAALLWSWHERQLSVKIFWTVVDHATPMTLSRLVSIDMRWARGVSAYICVAP